MEQEPKYILLTDYEGTKTKHVISNIQNAIGIFIVTLSGDEVAFILYNNGEYTMLDSSDARSTSILDDAEFILIKDLEEFNKRKEL